MTHRLLALAAAALFVGCTTRPEFFPNSDPSLHKSAAQFSADAAHRSYETDAPRPGDADGICEIDYGTHRLNIENSSPQDWLNAEIWVDKKYVIMVAKIPGNHARAELLPLNDIYDTTGHYVPYNDNSTPISSVEMYVDGKMYTFPIKLAD